MILSSKWSSLRGFEEKVARRTPNPSNKQQIKSKQNNSPMHQHPPTAIQPLLDELITSRKVLEQILIIHIIDLYDLVLETLEQSILERRPQDGQDVRDTGFTDGFFSAEGEEAEEKGGVSS